jgi:hypothetical protein
MIGAIAPLSGARNALVREAAAGSARDAEAARIIAEEADRGNDAAMAFATEAQGLLGMADVARCRADRLRSASARAAAMGFDKLAAMGADVALLQDQEADRIEGSVIGAVRESHSPGMFGYVSAEEQKLLHRKTMQERMTTGQLETGFRTMLDRMYDEARNYGAEGDDDEEVGTGESFARMGAAFEVFGGDVPAVFGANAYQGLFGFLKPSADRLRKRLERKQRRLAKAESRLETLEDSGKKGLQVKWLRMKVKKLERSIARIEGKLEKLDGAAEQVTNSAKKARTIEAAEQTKVQEAAGPDMDMDEDDEDVDFGLVAAADVYGLAPWRERRIRKRIRKLRAKLAKARRPRRQRKLRRRIRKLRARLTGRRRPAFRRRRARRQALTAPPMYGPSDDLGDDDDILYGLDDDLYGASEEVKAARKAKRQANRELKAAKAQQRADRLANRAAGGGGGIKLSLPGLGGDDDEYGDDYDLAWPGWR